MSFRDVAGQEAAVAFFRRAIETERLAHAYILVGPEGVGKRLLARALAQYVFCESRDGDSCGKCRSCRLIESGQFPDLHWYSREEGKQQVAVEVIEQFRHQIQFKPIETDHKVFILEDADKLNAASANRLLKILEEPPPKSLLLLLALDMRDFLPTVLSRCHVVRLRPLAADDLARRLVKQCGCSEGQARYLSHFTMGSPGLALTLATGGFFGERDRLIDMAVALRQGEQFAAAEEIFRLAGDGSDSTQERREVLMRTLDVLALFYRDVMACVLAGTDATLMGVDRKKDVETLAAKLSTDRVARILAGIEDARRALVTNANQKLLLENLAFDIARLQSP